MLAPDSIDRNAPWCDLIYGRISRHSSGVLLAISGTFLFALKSIFIKLAFASGANPTSLLTIRLLLSAPLYAAVLVYSRRRHNRVEWKPKPVGLAISLGFLGYYLASYLDMSGLEHISAQLERLTLFTYPAMVAVLAALFLGERLNRQIVVSLTLCYVGIWLMYSQERLLANDHDVTKGVMLVLGSALSYSLYVLLSKPLMQQMGSTEFTCLAMIGSAVFVGIHFLATQPITSLSTSASVWGYGALLAFVCTVIPSFMLNEAIVRLGAMRTAMFGTVGPVVTMLLAIVLLGEPSSLSHFVGMAVVLVGVAMVAKK